MCFSATIIVSGHFESDLPAVCFNPRTDTIGTNFVRLRSSVSLLNTERTVPDILICFVMLSEPIGRTHRHQTTKAQMITRLPTAATPPRAQSQTAASSGVRTARRMRESRDCFNPDQQVPSRDQTRKPLDVEWASKSSRHQNHKGKHFTKVQSPLDMHCETLIG